MKHLIITFAILLALAGAGAYIGWNVYHESQGPSAVTPAETPKPTPKVDGAALVAAREYVELTKQIESDKSNAELYAKRGRAMMDGKSAVMEDLPKLSELALEDLARADTLGYSSPQLYGDLMLALQWMEALHPMQYDDEGNPSAPPARMRWFDRVAKILDDACGRAPAAHRARVEFVEFRIRKIPAPADPAALKEKELESLDTLIKLDEGSDDAERAGDLAKAMGKATLAQAYFLKAIEINPSARGRIEQKMKAK